MREVGGPRRAPIAADLYLRRKGWTRRSSRFVLASAVVTSVLVGSTTVTLAPAHASVSPVVVAAPSSIAANCSADVSDALGQWLQGLPPNREWDAPAGACYLVNEGIGLKAVHGLTIKGGTFRSSDPEMAKPFFWVSGQDVLRNGTFGPWVRTVGSTDVTLSDMTVEGSHVPGTGYQENGAFLRSDGVVGLTVTDVHVSDPTGDGINLEPLRAPLGGGTIQNPSEGVSVSDFSVVGPGRHCFAPVSVDGASFTNVSCRAPGERSWDFEADQADEGAQNVVVDGCDNQGMVISSNAWFTGPITVRHCGPPPGASGPVALYVRSTTGSAEHGPITFDHDTFSCHGAGSGEQCFTLTNAANLVIQDSTVTLTNPQPVYVAQLDTHASFLDDTVTGYSTPGVVSANSSVTATGGHWAPAP